MLEEFWFIHYLLIIRSADVVFNVKIHFGILLLKTIYLFVVSLRYVHQNQLLVIYLNDLE